MYEFTFVRHGESVGNAEGYLQGQKDFPLTDNGTRQAKALADHWKNTQVTFDGMISSPLLRASQTAEIIQAALNIPLEFDPIWMERHIGKLAGLKHQEAELLHPRPKFMSLYDPVGETGESEWVLFLRAAEALERLLANPPGKYLVVSHGGLLGKLIASVLGIPLSPNVPIGKIRLSNASFSNFSYDPGTNRWMVNAINQTVSNSGAPKPEGDFRFVFLRHAESEGNRQGIFQGQFEYPLSKTGRVQTQSLAKRWKQSNPSFAKIISSPQQRTRETAQIIAEALNLPIETSSLLKEIDNGEWAGLAFNQIEENYPKSNHYLNPFVPLGENGESRWQFFIRSGKALQELMTNPPGEYLVVSHGGTLSRMIAVMLGISPQIFKGSPIFRLPNAGFATLDSNSKNGAIALNQFGDIRHLEKFNVSTSSI